MLTPRQLNILVDAAGHGRIADFGLAMVTQDMDSIRSPSIEHSDSVRWIAPEILDGRRTYSKEADIFSFAGVAIEVCRKQPPCSRLMASYRSFERRFLPELFRLATGHSVRQYWQSKLANVRHGQPTPL